MRYAYASVALWPSVDGHSHKQFGHFSTCATRLPLTENCRVIHAIASHCGQHCHPLVIGTIGPRASITAPSSERHAGIFTRVLFITTRNDGVKSGRTKNLSPLGSAALEKSRCPEPCIPPNCLGELIVDRACTPGRVPDRRGRRRSNQGESDRPRMVRPHTTGLALDPSVCVDVYTSMCHAADSIHRNESI